MQPKRVGTNERPMRGIAFIHAVFIQGRRLFGGGVYCKPCNKNCEFIVPPKVTAKERSV